MAGAPDSDDPEKDHGWAFEGMVDLAATDEAGEVRLASWLFTRLAASSARAVSCTAAKDSERMRPSSS